MTEQEFSAQRKKARANYELTQMKFRSGLVSQSDLDTAKRISDELNAYQMPPVIAPELKPVATDTVVVPSMPVSEFTALLERLTVEKADVHKQMCLRSNQLHTIPDNVSAKQLVDDIQDFKAKRTELDAQITYLNANGRLPDVAVSVVSDADQDSAFMESLPAEKYELAKLLDKHGPNLSKARKGLKEAKTETKRGHYRIKIARLEAEMAMIRTRMTTLA